MTLSRLCCSTVSGSALLAAFFSSSVFAAQAETEQSALLWNLVIAVIVLVFSLASAALPLAALRQWPQRSWRIAAILPLLVLALWVAIIVLSRLSDTNSHRLWPFEIFSWAMLNMIYMVAVMTWKRQFDKADDEKARQAQESVPDQAS